MLTVPHMIRPLRDKDRPQCEQTLRSLPDWFGIEQAIVEYATAAGRLETYVADIAGVAVGFLSLAQHNAQSAEIHVMAIRSEFHGIGLGRELLEEAERALVARSSEYLQVKTLGPSRPSKCYERTRGFYWRMGFRPLEETALWGPVNPCLIMVKHLACHRMAVEDKRADG